MRTANTNNNNNTAASSSSSLDYSLEKFKLESIFTNDAVQGFGFVRCCKQCRGCYSFLDWVEDDDKVYPIEEVMAIPSYCVGKCNYDGYVESDTTGSLDILFMQMFLLQSKYSLFYDDIMYDRLIDFCVQYGTTMKFLKEICPKQVDWMMARIMKIHMENNHEEDDSETETEIEEDSETEDCSDTEGVAKFETPNKPTKNEKAPEVKKDRRNSSSYDDLSSRENLEAWNDRMDECDKCLDCMVLVGKKCEIHKLIEKECKGKHAVFAPCKICDKKDSRRALRRKQRKLEMALKSAKESQENSPPSPLYCPTSPAYLPMTPPPSFPVYSPSSPISGDSSAIPRMVMLIPVPKKRKRKTEVERLATRAAFKYLKTEPKGAKRTGSRKNPITFHDPSDSEEFKGLTKGI